MKLKYTFALIIGTGHHDSSTPDLCKRRAKEVIVVEGP